MTQLMDYAYLHFPVLQSPPKMHEMKTQPEIQFSTQC